MADTRGVEHQTVPLGNSGTYYYPACPTSIFPSSHASSITTGTQHHAASRSITQHHAAPRSTTQHHATSHSTIQHHSAPSSITSTTQYHPASHGITQHHPASPSITQHQHTLTIQVSGCYSDILLRSPIVIMIANYHVLYGIIGQYMASTFLLRTLVLSASPSSSFILYFYYVITILLYLFISVFR